MNQYSQTRIRAPEIPIPSQNGGISGEIASVAGDSSPILIVPYMWIGDFVRCHSVVKLLQERWPNRPVDFLTSKLCAPILDYMPGVRKGVIWDLPRRSLPLGQYLALARQLRAERYGSALIMLRTWKSALAPFLAGIPERTGFFGEMRVGLINDMRFGERSLERMIDRCGALALPKGAPIPTDWPMPEVVVSQSEVADWRRRWQLPAEGAPVVALAPGAVGPGKAWPPQHYAALAQKLTQAGVAVWILGGPAEKVLAAEIVAAAGQHARDLTTPDLRNAILALATVDAAVTNDSGLMHIAAALGTPTIAIFGPTSPRLWSPLNPLAAVIEPPEDQMDIRNRRTIDIQPERVFSEIRRALADKDIAIPA